MAISTTATEDLVTAHLTVAKLGSNAAAARALGCSETTIRRRLKAPLAPDAYSRLYHTATNRMTGWQRVQWARAGYPGAHDPNPTALLSFLTARHP